MVLAAGALLVIPVVCQVQQVPGESTRRPAAIAGYLLGKESKTTKGDE